jgi:hypothetical protein
VLRQPRHDRPAVGSPELALPLEHGEIPPCSGRRDAQLLLQPGHRDTAGLADKLHYPLLASLRYVCAFR